MTFSSLTKLKEHMSILPTDGSYLGPLPRVGMNVKIFDGNRTHEGKVVTINDECVSIDDKLEKLAGRKPIILRIAIKNIKNVEILP